MTPDSPPNDLDRLPRWAPFAIYAVLTLLLFRQYLVGSTGDMLVGQDTIAAGIMMRSFLVEQFHELHRLPFWNPYLYGGVPTIEAGSGDILYPTSILHFLLPLTSALAWKLILHVFLAGNFMYLAARAFGVRRWVALLAGTAYLLSANLVSLVWGGQDGKMYVITLFPAGLGLLVAAMRRRSWVWFLWLGVVMGVMLLAHPQLAYYAYLALAAYGIGSIVARRGEGPHATVQRVAGSVLAVGTALAIAMIVLAPMYSYLREFSPRAGGGRGYEYSASWSLHAEELVATFIPDFAGTDVQADTYWGKNPFKHNLEYGGVLALVAGIASLFALRSDGRRFGLAALALAALLYGLGAGTPFFGLLYYLVPGFKNFRAPSLAAFIFISCFTILSALGLDRAVGGRDDRTRRILTTAFFAASGLALLVALAVQIGAQEFYESWSGLFGASPVPRSDQFAANIPHVAVGAILTALWCGAAGAALYGFGRGILSGRMLVLVLMGITIVDLIRVDDRYIQVVRYADFFPDDPGIAALRNSLKPGERVLALEGTFPNQGYLATYRVPEVFGYHGNQLRWYDELTKRGDREGARSAQELQQYWLSFLTGPVLRALSARVVILPGKAELTGYEFAGGSERVAVYRNTGALTGAAVVSGIQVEPDATRRIETLWNPGFDIRRSVVLAAPVPGLGADSGSAGGAGTAEFVSEGADSVVIRATTSNPAMLLVSRTFHPSWSARVDGSPVPVVAADHALIGVPLTTAGTHVVELRYRPRIVFVARAISLMAWALVILATAGYGIMRLRRAPAHA